jgi:hypothetical protein
MISRYKLNCTGLSVKVEVEDSETKQGIVVTTDPFLSNFIGRPLSVLTKHMKQFGKLSMYNLYSGKDKREIGDV